jgi:hypothetical protein
MKKRLSLAMVAFAPIVLGAACLSGKTGPGQGASGGSGDAPGLGGAGGQAAPSSFDAAQQMGGDGGAAQELPGTFVAVGYGGRTIRSTDDGVTWTNDAQLESGGGDDQLALRTVIWGNQQFVALGWRTMTSVDGTSWKDHGVSAVSQWIGSAVYVQQQYVAVGGYGLRATSPDALDWKAHGIDNVATHSGDALVYLAGGAGRFVSANDDGLRSYSTDGITWVYSTGSTATATNEVAFGNGVVVSLGGTSVVVSTDGGATWAAGATLASSCQGLLFAQGHFTALANGHVFTSSDGLTWADHAASSVTTGSVAYGHGSYVLVNGYQVSRSTDGLTWSRSVTLTGTNPLSWVTFGPTG